jgi:diguanylate cyclase (GGDEF)-like protein
MYSEPSRLSATSRRLLRWSPAGLALGVAGLVWAFWPGAVTKVLSEDYMPHGYCFFWNRQLVTLHVVSDVAIALAYVSIAATLTVLFFRERRRVPVAGIFAAFGVFIVACGLTHAMDVVVLWRPFYWVSGDLKLVTALASVTTAIVLPSLLPRIHRLIEAARSSRTNERRFLAASDSSNDAFFILRSERNAAGEIVDFRFLYANVHAARMLSSTPAGLAGQLLCENYPINRTEGFFERYKQVVETGESQTAEFPIHAEKINASWLRHHVVKLEDGIAITTTDVSAFKENEQRLTYLAQHDALTGLAERRVFEERLRAALERAPREGTAVGLLVVDCDNFKRMNDLLGHQAGDALLTQFAARITTCVGSADTVARVGGDEFMVVLSDLRAPGEAETIARQILTSIQQPMAVEGQSVRMTASIGVCVYPDDEDCGTQSSAAEACATLLLKNADAAMYRAKMEGRDRVQVFTREMAGSLARRRLVDASLQHALEADEFALVYQPRVDLRTGLVTGVEALLRWQSEELGTVMPTEFIPLAEENGLIVPIGRWVLEHACAEMAELERWMGRRVPVAVNVSPRQFQQQTLAAEVASLLQRHRMSPEDLELEITESLLLQESPFTRDNFEQVRGLGVHIAIDDFGTGYSSMSYLTRFGVDRLKIDQSFVRRMNHDPESDAICKAIVGLAGALKIRVVAEGVETVRQRDVLRTLGCDEAQGNLYAAPVPMLQLAALLHAIEFEVVTPAAA